MSQVLIETLSRSPLRLVESASSDPKYAKFLGIIEGPCADWINETRNTTRYSRQLWYNVFNKDPLVIESVNTLTCFGELDHPPERSETEIKFACVVLLEKPTFDDKLGQLIGKFGILPTEYGKIVRNLIEVGCQLGVSSRGNGDLLSDGFIDENTYEFIGFDVVATPSVKVARPSITEGVRLNESLMS